MCSVYGLIMHGHTHFSITRILGSVLSPVLLGFKFQLKKKLGDPGLVHLLDN